MNIPILIEPVAHIGWRATLSFGLSAEGATAEEARARVLRLLADRVKAGGKLDHLAPAEMVGDLHPLAPFAGMFKEDPLFDEWVAAMREYRREVDERPDAW